MTTRLSPQLSTLLDHLQQRGSISNVEAQSIHRIRALPRRISDLEELGFVFMRQSRNDTTGQRYVRYFLLNRRNRKG